MDLRTRKREVVRGAIVESAFALFEECGFEATTVAMIASRAGVSSRTVHRYFASKESIAFAELDGEIEHLADVVRRHCAERVDMPCLVAAFAEWLGGRAGHPRFPTLAALMRDNVALLGRADCWRRELAERIATVTADLAGDDVPGLADHARAGAVVSVSATAISHWVRSGCSRDLGALVREAGDVLCADATV